MVARYDILKRDSAGLVWPAAVDDLEYASSASKTSSAGLMPSMWFLISIPVRLWRRAPCPQPEVKSRRLLV
jgi:hypothetical protein